ncbi:alpha/beta fold hydrolase [Nitratireductor soli]|uniref:alpha/beta fold hydrolase n=1 Tax=Nitratireductor soli TaxID=1670619 RepID=UPI00065E2F56|nr:alpha/beta fold hydrolase [Nitratireductor soli]
MSERLYADDTGDSEDDGVLVLLHGFAGTHGVWDGVRAALPPGLRIIAYDLPGHGQSLSYPSAGKARATAGAVLNDLAERGVNRFHLAGHSFGGAVAVLAGLAAPGKLASLTLCAPGGFGSQINGAALAARAAARSETEMRAALTGMFGMQMRLPSLLVEQAMRLSSLPGQREKLIEISSLIASGDRQGAFPRDRLAVLPAPVHVVWGTLDAVLPIRQADHLPDGFVLHRLEGAGHMLPEEAPEALARIMAQVIAEI